MSFVSRVAIVILMVAVALGAWFLRDVLLIAFGGLIVACALSAGGERVRQLTRLPTRWAVGLTVLVLTLAVAALLWWAGGALADQFGRLKEDVPRAVEALRDWLADHSLGQRALELWETSPMGELTGPRVAGAAGATIGAIGTFLLVLLLGLFMALEPELHVRGMLRLVPPRHRSLAAETMADVGRSLRGWLKGQGVAMLFVGAATGAGLALLGIPLALILGVIAGVLAFVPFLGPIASGALAILVAFVEGPRAVLEVAVLVFLIQQIEGNLLEPFIQRWAVALPPVLGLIAVVIFSTLFGIPGVLFATPLMVTLVVLVKHLYVERIEGGAGAVTAG